MKNVRFIAFAVALGIGAATAVACGGTVEAPQTSAGVSKAPIGANTHGMVKVIGEALGEVPLRAEQRTELEQLAQAAETRHQATAAGRKELALAIADQIEKGAVDRAALQPKVDRVVAEFEKLRPEDRAAVARMHAILDKEQRSAFVDALESNFENKHGFGEKAAGMMKLKALADELKLTDEQRSKIIETMRQARHAHGAEAGGEHHAKGDRTKGEHHRTGMHHGKKVLEAFREDRFDANQGMPAPNKERIEKAETRFIDTVEKILPLLTPEQRKIAADKIRNMAAKGDLNQLSH